MTTDYELTQRCARAIGLRLEVHTGLNAPPEFPSAVRVSQGKKKAYWYDPLHNKAHALDLLLSFGLSVKHNDGMWEIFDDTLGNFDCVTHSDLQRAIMVYVSGVTPK